MLPQGSGHVRCSGRSDAPPQRGVAAPAPCYTRRTQRLVGREVPGMTIRALLLSAAAVVALSSPALAQQPAPQPPREDDTPSFTTDDASAPIVGQPAGAQTQAPPEDDSGLTPEERADAAAKGTP